jgi:hypothetical protein
MSNTDTEKPPHWLLKHSANTHSQAGEDGIIQKILELLPIRDRWCVEFGAWDGIYYSNSRRLITEENYSSVLIEPDPVKFGDLTNNYQGNAKVIPLNCLVGFTHETGLDLILEPTPIPKDFDFLSVDIDGADYHVWKAMEHYRPKAMVIEFNPTMPIDVSYIQPADGTVHHGNSLRALCELAKEKGYQLVCAQHFNAFFVDEKYFSLFDIADNSPEAMWQNRSCVTHIFTAHDGSIHLHGSLIMPWHELRMEAARMQMLPRYFRAHPDTYSWLKKQLFALYRCLVMKQ